MSNIPEYVSQPDLINFEETEEQWADLSDDDKREWAVTMLQQITNFGHHDVPEGRREAYGDIIAPGESRAMRAGLLEKKASNSSSGLVVRTIWRMLGAKDYLLDPPYKPGMVFTQLIKYADKHGALTRLKPGDDFDPQPGDALLIQGPNNSQHIFMIERLEDDIVVSVDGGQNYRAENYEGGRSRAVDDGGCNGIHRRRRQLDRETLTFNGDPHNVITGWIDITRLPFSEPMVRFTKWLNDDDVR